MKNLLWAEIVKVKADYRYYWFEYLLTHINFLILFSGLFYVNLTLNPRMIGDEFLRFIFGVYIWYFSYSIIVSSTSVLSEEIILGTLNQLSLTATSLFKILLGRQFLEICISFFFLFFFTLIFSLQVPSSFLFEISFKRICYVILLFLISSPGLFGIGLGIASLTFIFRKAKALANLTSYLFLFFSGSMISYELLPGMIKKLIVLIPLFWVNKTFEKILVNEAFYQQLAIILLLSFVYLCCGIQMFRFLSVRRRV